MYDFIIYISFVLLGKINKNNSQHDFIENMNKMLLHFVLRQCN